MLTDQCVAQLVIEWKILLWIAVVDKDKDVQ